MGDKHKHQSDYKIPLDKQYGFIEEIAKISAKINENQSGLKEIKQKIDNLNIEEIHTVLADFNVDKLSDQFDESISQIETQMDASGYKNTLKFSGKSSENVTTFLQKLSFLAKANTWSNEKYFAQILLSLDGTALRYYNNAIAQEPEKFQTQDEKDILKDDPEKLRKFLKKSFESSNTFADILSKVVNDPQRRSESCESYCDRMIDSMDSSSEVIDEKIQMGLLLNGLRSDISQALRQRADITNMNDLVTWARKLEKIYDRPKPGNDMMTFNSLN